MSAVAGRFVLGVTASGCRQDATRPASPLHRDVLRAEPSLHKVDRRIHRPALAGLAAPPSQGRAAGAPAVLVQEGVAEWSERGHPLVPGAPAPLQAGVALGR